MQTSFPAFKSEPLAMKKSGWRGRQCLRSEATRQTWNKSYFQYCPEIKFSEATYFPISFVPFTWIHICARVIIVGLHAYIFFMLPLAVNSGEQYWLELWRRCCVSADHACGSAVKCCYLTETYQFADSRSAYCQYISLSSQLFSDEMHHVPSTPEAYTYFANFIRNIQ